MPVSADTVLRTSFHSIATWLNAHPEAAPEITSDTQPMTLDTAPNNDTTAASASLADSASTAQTAAQKQIIAKIMEEMIFHSRAEVCCLHSCQ